LPRDGAPALNAPPSAASRPEAPETSRGPGRALGAGRGEVNGAADLARSPGQEAYLQAIEKNEIVFCIGPAGTGKTFLAVHMAVSFLREGLIRRIILCRPAVEAGEKLGFLPGDFQAKINPYLRPLYDALNDILDYDQVKRYLEREIIEIIPLAYMRGRTLNNAFIILDEGQNTSISQMKMFLTRMGMESRIVVNGDVTQVDLPDGIPSGLIHAQRIIREIPGIAWIRMEKRDIVRHPLVRRIVEAYEAEAGAS
jgi:phosphate starvation-inducible PhoH-like protein